MSKKVMHTRELVGEVARRTRYSYGQTRQSVRGVLEELATVIAEQLAEGQTVSVAGFGRFEAKEHQGREVVGLDGGIYEIERRLVPSFRPYPHLRQQVQGKVAEPEQEDPDCRQWWL